MNIRKVLVFPAATEIGLEINEALRQCKEISLVGAGFGGSTHAPFAFEAFFELPSIHQSDWLDRLIELCHSLSLDYIFPAYDDAIVALAESADRLPAHVLAPPLDICKLTRSKRNTYRALADIVRVPELYEAEPAADSFPVFVKPDRGQGSQGARLVHDAQQLRQALAAEPDLIACEYLPGQEYTVDCFSDREHGLLFAKARIRTRTRNGIAVNTVSINLPEARAIGERIHARLGMRGAWFFQLKRASNGMLALLEVAPRIAGSMSTHRVAGVNFPLLTIFEHERLPISILLNDGPIELDRSLRNRFRHSVSFGTLYIDLDDTLVLRNKVNLDAIRLVFLARNQQARVVLITRHSEIGRAHV